MADDEAHKIQTLLKRIVDYHSPLATGDLEKAKVDVFNNFVDSMFQTWMVTESKQLKNILSQQV